MSRRGGRRKRRRARTDVDGLAGAEDELGWMWVGDRRMFVVGFTAGGAPYGCYEDEFEGETGLTPDRCLPPI